MVAKAKVIRKAKAPKKVPKPKPPKTRNGGTMTEAAFRSWVRSQLRRMSQRWKPIYMCKKDAQRDATPAEVARFSKGRGKIRKVYECARCTDRVPDKLGAVDHVIPCGTLIDIEKDAGPFILRMLCEQPSLRWLCDPCHHTITQEQRENPSS